jgi:SH3-like domain-containing protein
MQYVCRLQPVWIIVFIVEFFIFSTPCIGAERLAVAVSVANIRTGPGTNYDVLWSAEKYFPFLVIETTGSWVKLRDFEGDEGWVNKSLIAKIPSVITKKPECSVRSGPGTGYPVLFTAGIGIPFRVVKKEGDWLYVEHADGETGWIHKGLTW